MRHIRSPAEYHGSEPSVFLAGGISGCPDWQAEMVRLLKDVSWTLINPRRSRIDLADQKVALEQIEWEHRHLRRAKLILFWFPQETICPITLYELGAWTMTSKPLCIGVHPEYPRRFDVEVQTRLTRPELQIVHSLEELAAAVQAAQKDP